ncbi:DUF2281 domain-containing protein [Brumimicrobium oceani]|uniref:DUF2281 domain-containing protein n=1 Tax=Brumimicrobium oceani TaxID=2100725 RepID=A0A2U2XBZ4_9FLAO|nr:hypothetical protein DIT68_10045 [Brumimicrobium oceani]
MGDELVDFIEVLKKQSKDGGEKNIPKFGSWKGLFKMKKYFDDTIKDFR